jgi:hypothetical protein
MLAQFVEFLRTLHPHEALDHMTSQQLMRFLLDKYCNLSGYPAPTQYDVWMACALPLTAHRTEARPASQCWPSRTDTLTTTR